MLGTRLNLRMSKPDSGTVLVQWWYEVAHPEKDSKAPLNRDGGDSTNFLEIFWTNPFVLSHISYHDELKAWLGHDFYAVKLKFHHLRRLTLSISNFQELDLFWFSDFPEIVVLKFF